MSAVLKEEIPDNHFVFRSIRYSGWSKQNKKRPQEACFSPIPDGLSVNWEKHCELENVFVILGSSKNIGNGKYKDFREFKAIKFKVAEIRNIQLLEPFEIDVIHDPQPDNYSHSLVRYDENSEEIRIKLADIVEAQYDLIVFKPTDHDSIETKIQEIRKKEAEALLRLGDNQQSEELEEKPLD
ncbi:MAG: hypothetical protein ABUL44_02555 [Flavobacterium sp.]